VAGTTFALVVIVVAVLAIAIAIAIAGWWRLLSYT